MLLMKRPKGIFCPNCLKPGKSPYTRYRPTAGTRVRYFKCACGCRFKTVERLQEPRQNG